MILEARRTSWRAFTSQLSLRTDARKVWGTLKALDGKPAPIRQDEELRVGSKTYSTDKRKADAFMKVYAQASHLPPRVKRDRPFHHGVTKSLRRQCAECGGRRTDCCSPFSREELDAAILKLAGRKAPGPDLVTNELIVHLCEAGRQKLLELANMSWVRGELPSIWRKGIIVPILKKGKPRDLPSSYRPVQPSQLPRKGHRATGTSAPLLAAGAQEPAAPSTGGLPESALHRGPGAEGHPSRRRRLPEEAEDRHGSGRFPASL